jgi:hypothetical protein
MWNKSTGRWGPYFALSHLKNLPSNLQIEGEKLRTVYVGFEDIATSVLAGVDVVLSTTYSKFLKNEAYDLYVQAWEIRNEIGEKKNNEKLHWVQHSLHLVLESIMHGHDRIDQAYQSLKIGDTADFSGKLSEAAVFFGRLTMIYDLSKDDSFNRIGSIQSALAGAALGGIKSGITRRRQSRVPTPEVLRVARQNLVDAGKPHREISAMLAKKYNCTTDHIRKILKRD